MSNPLLYEGTTWHDLYRSSRNPDLWLELKPINNGEVLRINVTHIDGFLPNTHLDVEACNDKGREVYLAGRCGLQEHDPLQLVLIK